MPLSVDLAFGLPANARPDLAFTDVSSIPRVSGSPWENQHVVPGDYIEILLSLAGQYHADASAGNRNMDLTFSDEIGNALATMPSATTQAPSTDFRYTWSPAVSQQYSDGVINVVIPLPLMVMYPQYAFTTLSIISGNGDFFRSLFATIIHIPTGPYPDAGTPAPLIPTPLLV